ncbi:Peroxide stress regulator PerR, FUR family [Fructilactobacillus florum 8D]|uniref:Peroxide stress regulator PerR, FUR family n=2 Tax=Fructilactobacillus florum TaxID=640331 RepID=W9EFB8_9LACO|nr:Fur family transcriptional regulator [Fructilactobacillus florum]EKK20363.1 Peroxide stress regulator PerR, FUR family [Fructilactobacillus florum 2F]ETO40777.1 Peroxide stress regulator PerR, FUR family [Fructilactobacillus florum 8D]KRM90565.1 Peroxide-responsive repressor perR [Fructilactobacillus florum DSM 22689 = JCM 16035]
MADERYDNAMQRLKDNDVRITPQRQIILKYLIDTDDHPSVETIFHILGKTFPNLSMATVYNNLRLFKRLNLIIEMPSVDGGYRYDFYDHPHLHATCDNCNNIFDLEDPEFEEIEQHFKEIATKDGFKPTITNVEIHGICSDCQKKETAQNK